jgi:ferric-chelate reductase
MLQMSETIKSLDPAFALDLHLHFTAPESSITDAEDKIGLEKPEGQLHAMIHQGRPDIPAILAKLIAIQPDGNGGLGVGACGPTGLGDSVERIVKAVPCVDRRRIGGVELHVERFSL